MSYKKSLFILFFALVLCLLPIKNSYSGASFDIIVTDNANKSLVGFFDLRERETFIQITNQDPDNNNVHILIFDVSNNCNENNFFDAYTVNDTNVYNLRDIQTNDGNDSGVILPDDAYGVFIAFSQKKLIGNLRILDSNGYEYRTNLLGARDQSAGGFLEEFATFNFNTLGGITLSDIVLISMDDDLNIDGINETELADILDVWSTVDVTIYDLNENAFSCRKVIYACVNKDSPLYEALLEEAANETAHGCGGGDCAASVADIEYGINEAIPHSKGGELLCPGNNITEGFVRLERMGRGSDAEDDGLVFVGLNNGNGRGSIDVFFNQNNKIPVPEPL